MIGKPSPGVLAPRRLETGADNMFDHIHDSLYSTNTYADVNQLRSLGGCCTCTPAAGSIPGISFDGFCFLDKAECYALQNIRCERSFVQSKRPAPR